MNKDEFSKSADLKSVLKVIRAILRIVSKRRSHQLLLLLAAQIFGAISELISIMAVIPFIESLNNPESAFKIQQLQWLINYFEISTDRQLITFTTLLFAVSVIYVNVIRILVLRFELMLSATIGADISTNVYSNSLLKPYEYYTKNSSSKLVSIITNDLGALLLVVNNTLKIITNLFIVIAILIGLFAYDPKVVFSVFVTISSFFLIILALNKKRLVGYGHISTDNHHKIMKMVQESIGGIRNILMGGYQKEFINDYSPLDRNMRLVRAKSTIIRTIPRYILEILAVITLSLAILVFSSISQNGNILSLFALLAMAGSRLLPTINMVYSSYAGLQNHYPAIIKALDSIKGSDEIYFQKEKKNNNIVNGNIIFKNVYFSYDHHKQDWALDNINLEIPKNSVIALVGKTGSGKTTISDILLGLLKPSKGEVFIGNKALNVDNVKAWRDIISHVPQSVYLSDSSIKENIAFGIPVNKIDSEKLIEVSKIACLDEFIDRREKGLNEIIGENGIRLSGGQRQRIGIARALYSNPKLIVLDEATSSLDSSTEFKVINAIKKLSEDITIVLLSHRLSTIKDADRIYEINDGKIIHSGTFDEMLNNSDSFSRMVLENTI